MSSPERPNLAELWERHCFYEFDAKDVDATIETMVANPYVIHIPTQTGGRGRKELHAFYRDHFIPCVPADVKQIPISRTIGESRVVDEFLFCATHDRVIDFMLPGIPATGKYFEIPLVAIVSFEKDKIANEHIHWDQASLLFQLGLIEKNNLPIVGKHSISDLLPNQT
jgi:carboxymethylenebutenolidase